MWDPRGRRCQTPSNIVHCKKDKIKILLPLKIYKLVHKQTMEISKSLMTIVGEALYKKVLGNMSEGVSNLYH